jgi:hypothetical protein
MGPDIDVCMDKDGARTRSIWMILSGRQLVMKEVGRGVMMRGGAKSA